MKVKRETLLSLLLEEDEEERLRNTTIIITFVHGNNENKNNVKDGCGKGCNFLYEPIFKSLKLNVIPRERV